MNISKSVVIALITASLTLAGFGLVVAQEAVTGSDDFMAQGFRQQGQRFHGGQQGQQGRRDKQAGRQAGFRGGVLPRAMMIEGTSLEVLIYDANPDEGGQLLDSLSHVVGESSERIFMESVHEAMLEATYMVVNTGESNRIISLPAELADVPARRGFNLPIRGLNEGSSLTATFYDSHPDEGGLVLTTLSFVQGESSEVAFANELREAVADASHVEIVTSAQSRQLDLTTMRDHARDGRHELQGLRRLPLGR